MKSKRFNRRSARAFTIVATRLLPKIGSAKRTTALANAKTIANEVQQYIADCGPPPAGAAIADYLMARPANVPEEKWHGPYLQNSSQLIDPWNNSFVLVYPGQKNADLDVVSYGADGLPGGTGENADIVAP
jgi:general secretion pathway protein G